ncbi:hypothetical protein EXIGLDRAFT_492161 [Exidia glandulosa HHB12029]|uniref:Uncharacterized protein n=1 Tax=Exidia glandulosa HHB12029 TaxID=1314781 RepID=A0A165JL73_EXIGL|nr:hypothetical protein EXIGLDRAFT_492161 [Exidia glandulosa HHB12029]
MRRMVLDVWSARAKTISMTLAEEDARGEEDGMDGRDESRRSETETTITTAIPLCSDNERESASRWEREQSKDGVRPWCEHCADGELETGLRARGEHARNGNDPRRTRGWTPDVVDSAPGRAS